MWMTTLSLPVVTALEEDTKGLFESNELLPSVLMRVIRGRGIAKWGNGSGPEEKKACTSVGSVVRPSVDGSWRFTSNWLVL